MRILNRIFVLVLLALVLTACAVNPVTGQRELALLSEREEVAIGEQHYGTTQQSMGGPYTTDEALNRYISRVGQSLAEVSDRPHLPYEFVVINDSTPNAWACRVGRWASTAGCCWRWTVRRSWRRCWATRSSMRRRATVPSVWSGVAVAGRHYGGGDRCLRR